MVNFLQKTGFERHSYMPLARAAAPHTLQNVPPHPLSSPISSSKPTTPPFPTSGNGGICLCERGARTPGYFANSMSRTVAILVIWDRSTVLRGRAEKVPSLLSHPVMTSLW